MSRSGRRVKAPSRLGPGARELALRAALSVARRASGRVWVSLEPEQGWSSNPRWGWGRPPQAPLLELLNTGNDRYRAFLDRVRAHGAGLRAIPRTSEDPLEPVWDYRPFSGLDLAGLYCLLLDRRPRRYVEVGSGNSTRIAARASRDGSLDLRITSIDPDPRLPIDRICTHAARSRLEDADLEAFAELEAGDVALLDGSHRVLPGNDVATFFIDVLPRLPAGVLVGVHDIYLPDDYPAEHVRDYFSEQYMLAAHLLASVPMTEIVLPCHHVCVTSGLVDDLHTAWRAAGLDGINAYGNAFWWITG